MEHGGRGPGKLDAVHPGRFRTLKEKVRSDLGDSEQAWGHRACVPLYQQRGNGLPDSLVIVVFRVDLFLDCPVLANAPEEIRVRGNAHISGALQKRGKIPNGEEAPQ